MNPTISDPTVITKGDGSQAYAFPVQVTSTVTIATLTQEQAQAELDRLTEQADELEAKHAADRADIQAKIAAAQAVLDQITTAVSTKPALGAAQKVQ
jgi:hypothetical protein